MNTGFTYVRKDDLERIWYAPIIRRTIAKPPIIKTTDKVIYHKNRKQGQPNQKKRNYKRMDTYERTCCHPTQCLCRTMCPQ